jgi:hypothetical protein
MHRRRHHHHCPLCFPFSLGGFVTRTQTKRGEVSRYDNKELPPSYAPCAHVTTYRSVCAILGVARALGDTFLQPVREIRFDSRRCSMIRSSGLRRISRVHQMVTCVPDVFEIALVEHDVLILACDGFVASRFLLFLVPIPAHLACGTLCRTAKPRSLRSTPTTLVLTNFL